MPDLVRSLIPASAPTMRLPATYEAAKQALARCESVDECKDWINKSAAIAEYARQAKDDTLVIMAQRIQARAIRRAGELLKEVPHLHGPRCAEKGPTRAAVGEAAGMGLMQRRYAARFAQIPAKKFEQLVESAKPPAVYLLAEVGRKKRYAPGRPKGGAIGVLRRRLERAEELAREKTAELAAANEAVTKLRAQIAQHEARAQERKKP